MPLDNSGAGSGRELMPRATIEEIVAHRNKALELYADAFRAIAVADTTLKAAHTEAAKATPNHATRWWTNERHHELEAFHKAVSLPDEQTFKRVARKLTDLNVWAWVVEYTDLRNLMDAEAKNKLDQQMTYVPEEYRYDHKTNRQELITGEEIERGMPPVTVENIYATLQHFAADADNIFRRGIANAFSKLDRRFKSHDGFKIGSRIILTYAFSGYSGSLGHGETRDTLLDIERAFAVLDNEGHIGARYGRGVYALDQDRRDGSYGPRQSETDTPYFKIRGYKNGNAHLWFTRDDLVEKVNKILAEWYGEVIGDGQQAEPDIFDHSAAAGRSLARRFGFFPTPDSAADKLMEEVSLHRTQDEPWLRILEPSAGTGNLARRCALAERGAHDDWSGGKRVTIPARPFNHQVDCIEVQPALARALEAEGIYRRVTCADFLKVKPAPAYDRIVMNPPFDLERDIDHIIHALKFLKPDGELVAIMSAGTEFRETKKARAFRELMKKMGGVFQDLPAGSFSESGTNVNTIILKVWAGSKETRWSRGWGHRFA